MGLLPLAPEASASASSATSAVEIYRAGNRHYNVDGRSPVPPMRHVVLWVLLALFFLRVLGQLLVVAGLAPFLPPIDDWQSGLLPYPLLLTSQILIVALLSTVCVQFTRGAGYFVKRRAWLGIPLWIAGWFYAIAMVVRYALLRRDAIPVVFHIILATFLIVVAHHHRQARSG